MVKHSRVYLFLSLLVSNLIYAQELRQVTLQASWFEQFQFAGYYMAKEKGFYRDAGLEVTINPFEIHSQSGFAQQVMNGEIDFAIGKEALILEKARNKHIVMLYALFQASPLVLLTTKESNIYHFTEFFGKKIMATIGDAQQVSLRAMLNANHIQRSDLQFLPHSHNINDLINNKTDIISAYISKSPFDLEKMGVQYNVFSPADYGFDLYSDFLYTSEELIAKDMPTVNAFREASLKGWQYAFANIEESVDVVFAKYNQQKISKEALFFEANALKKLAYLNTEVLGLIDQSKVEKSFDLYKVLGVEKGNIDFSQIIYDVNNPRVFFTQQEKAYLNQKKKISMCIDPNWLPYEALDSEGKHIGINTEFLDIFKAQLPIPLETVITDSWAQSLDYAKQRKCDLLSLARKTKKRSEFLNFTSTYLKATSILVTKSHMPFVDDFTQLANQKVGIVKGYALKELVKKVSPDIIIVDVDSMEDGLNRVVQGELYGFFDELDAASYILHKRFKGQLQVSGKLDNQRKLGIAVRNDELLLLNIFEKLVTNLSEETIKKITDKSTTIKYVAEFDYKYIWLGGIVILFISAAFVCKQRMLKNMNTLLHEKVTEKTKELLELNTSLERKIKERTHHIERSKEILQNVAYKDNLTGTFNRHYLFEKSPNYFQVSDDLEQPLFLLLIDLDHFKIVNDTHGHIAGDNLLKYFVKSIHKTLRSEDLFARYGGEEFIVLLPKINLEECLLVAEKLRVYIAEHPFHSDEINASIPITISIGVSQYKKGDSLVKLIDRADSALYKAKESGRNQVQIA